MFSVANAGKLAVTLQLLGRTPTADFRVYDSADRLLWSLLRGQTMLSALRLYPLEPGQRLRFRHSWDQRADTGKTVAPGEYRVRGVLLTDAPGGLPSPPARLRITG